MADEVPGGMLIALPHSVVILTAITWNADPYLFGIIRWYSLLMFLAIYISFVMLQRFFSGAGLPGRKHSWLIFYQAAFCLVGSRLAHCFLYEPEIFLNDPIRILYVWEGGLSSHGAALGLIAGLVLYRILHLREKSFLWLIDRVTISMVPGMALIRIGNFMNSELYGTPTEFPWGVIFVAAPRAGELPRHPVQLYEAISYAAFFIFLWYYLLRRAARFRDGIVLGFCLAGILSIRFAIEFMKEFEEAIHIFGIRFYTGQILSVPFILAGIALIICATRRSSGTSR